MPGTLTQVKGGGGPGANTGPVTKSEASGLAARLGEAPGAAGVRDTGDCQSALFVAQAVSLLYRRLSTG